MEQPETLEDLKRRLAKKRAETDRLIQGAEEKLDAAERAIQQREAQDQDGA